ncbi:SIMPL domain-containing protein [Halanaerobium hydrogeniformans]|uniref:Periplasmic immunogenic protein n=1 Tax=Halanaerobium hydrogeniformans TaxID=656519 RepID=E4RL16_HALHG|nr:SIMPL domain-containing protein [Halanaerobium hydrogeniformans]ADQ14780.1 protein of unknown function DUF541 [Halanaerobium hydrogeniformans]
MNRNAGLFLVFLALILLSVLVINGLYFNTNDEVVAPEEVVEERVEEDYITTSLSISQQKEFDPEIVDVVLGFENEDQEQSVAVRENNEIVSALMDILEEEDLESLETQYFRVYPFTRYEDEERVTYYRVSNQLKFRTEHLEELPVLLGRLLEAGANRVVSLDYRLRNNEAALDEVTAMALDSLKSKSAFIAQNLDKEDYRITKLNMGRQDIYGADMLQSVGRRSAEADSMEVPVKEEKVNISVSLSAEVELY